MSRVLLIRHGETRYELAEQRRLIGAARELVPLTTRGIRQIEQRADALRGRGLEMLVASPLTRALQSAAILSRRLDLPLAVEYDLHEWVPDLSYRWNSVEQMWAAYNEMMALGGEWPEGEERAWEPLSAVRRRVLAVLERYRHLDRVGVVCHGLIVVTLTGSPIEVAETVEVELPPAGDGAGS